MIHQIDHGELKINNQTLIISDNAKTAHIIPLFLSIALIIQSAASITKWIVDGQITDAFDYIYIPVFLIGIGLFIHQMRFNTLRELNVNDICDIKYVERIGNSWVDIYTNSKIRRIPCTKTTFRILNEWQQTNALYGSETSI